MAKMLTRLLERDTQQLERNVLTKLILYTTVLHSLFLAYDIYHPNVFLHADRALSRYANATALLLQDDIVSFLSKHGIIGDYVFHALLYDVVGQYGVIFVQVLLLIFSVVALFKLVLLMTQSVSVAVLTVLIYVHLPHTLVFPHQLMSEALSNPLVIISFYYLGEYLLRSRRLEKILTSAIFLGIATLVRPISMLWPFVVVGVVLVVRFRKNPLEHWFAYLCVATLPLFLWMVFMWQATGSFSIGTSHHLQRQLNERVERMISTFPNSERHYLTKHYMKNKQGIYDELTIKEYFAFVVDHPSAYVKHLARDAVVFIAKPGINRLLLDYFGASAEARREIQNPKRGWRAYWERYGLMRTLSIFLEKYPTIVLPVIVASFVFILFVLLTLTGVWTVAKKWKELASPERLCYCILLLFPVYLLFSYQVVGAIQSRYRSPSEFILAMFVAIAVFSFCPKKNVKSERIGSNRPLLTDVD